MTVTTTEKPYLQEAICAGFFNKPAETRYQQGKSFATPEVMTYVRTLTDSKVDDGINAFLKTKIEWLSGRKTSYEAQKLNVEKSITETSDQLATLQTFYDSRTTDNN